MNIDLNNPITIVIFIIFGFGSQLWLEWLKRQIELDGSKSHAANDRQDKLVFAFRKILFFFSVIWLFFCLGFLFYRSFQIMAYRPYYGYTSVLALFSMLLRLIYFLKGEVIYKQVSRLLLSLMGIPIGLDGLQTNQSLKILWIISIVLAILNGVIFIYQLIKSQYLTASDKLPPKNNSLFRVDSEITVYIFAAFALCFVIYQSIAPFINDLLYRKIDYKLAGVFLAIVLFVLFIFRVAKKGVASQAVFQIWSRIITLYISGYLIVHPQKANILGLEISSLEWGQFFVLISLVLIGMWIYQLANSLVLNKEKIINSPSYNNHSTAKTRNKRISKGKKYHTSR